MNCKNIILDNNLIEILDNLSNIRKKTSISNDIDFKIIQDSENNFEILLNKAYFILYDIYILKLNNYNISESDHTIKEVFIHVSLLATEIYMESYGLDNNLSDNNTFYMSQNIYLQLFEDFFKHNFDLNKMILDKISIKEISQIL